MLISLNPDLNIEVLSAKFHQTRRLRIENIFTEESANAIAEQLTVNTDWHLVHSDEKGLPVRYDADKVANMTADEQSTILASLHQRAAHSYQYIYKFFPIIDAIKAGALSGDSILFQIANLTNGTEFMHLARRLTQTNSLVKFDPQATLYEAGHFLTTHDDSNYQRSANDSSTRRFALVFGFTKEWSVDWGGQTNFFPTSNAKSAMSWFPGFNTLSIFQVPTLHSVSHVAPFAPHGRYSITGWLRDDPSIKRPDLGDR